MSHVPAIRIQALNSAEVNRAGSYVLYWMTAYRRPHWNFALQRAVECCSELKKPLVVLEALRIGYPWASDRIHRFVIDGMLDHSDYFANTPVCYFPYVELSAGAGKGLLQALSRDASIVVTDDYPAFFLPRMLQAAARQLTVRLEKVDGNGFLPLRHSDRVFPTAYAFRRELQKSLKPHLELLPSAKPIAGLASEDRPQLRRELTERWRPTERYELEAKYALETRLPVDHSVPTIALRGGFREGEMRAQQFTDERLSRYAEERNHPDDSASSGLSPWLHFGHASPYQLFYEISANEGWQIDQLPSRASGSRSGWWQLSASAEAFLDELITWRELGFHSAAKDPSHADYSGLPQWARQTLAQHSKDRRAHVYALSQLQAAETHDEVWNASQRQLLTEGVIHNYLRMLWGKKILEWTVSPEQAFEYMVQLNNNFAIDGRDPNSYSGIAWVLGRYDRAWGPERPIFGKIRYMSSESTKRKLRMRDYLSRYGGAQLMLD